MILPEKPQELQVPCPCCFESSGHPAIIVPATWTDPSYADVDYSRRCPECDGTGMVDGQPITLDDLEDMLA